MSEPGPKRPVPALQRLLDNPWWLLLLGVAIPALSYTAWGWISMMSMAKATLP